MHIAIPCLAALAGAALGLRLTFWPFSLTTPLVVAVVTSVEFASGAPWRAIALSVVLAVVASQVGYLLAVLHPYRLRSRALLVAAVALASFFPLDAFAASRPTLHRQSIDRVVEISYDPGGNLGEYLARFDGYRDHTVHVHITGVCGSGCTLVTRLPEKNVCVTMDARLVFHQANDLAPGVQNWLATQHLTGLYPPWVREWIAKARPGVLGPGYRVMDTAELTKHYAVCSNDTIARR